MKQSVYLYVRVFQLPMAWFGVLLSQWSSTREDLFPDSLCRILGRLHDQAPTHSYKQTRRAILKHFKHPIEAIFDDFPVKPFASGSIAQVSYLSFDFFRRFLHQLRFYSQRVSGGLVLFRSFGKYITLLRWRCCFLRSTRCSQVYRARLKDRGDDTPLNVAVKVFAFF